MKMKAYELEDFIGENMIVRCGDETKPLTIQTLVRYEDHHSGSALPVIEDNEGQYLSFATMLPYSPELWSILQDIGTPEAQWDFMVKIKHFVVAHSRRCNGKRSS